MVSLSELSLPYRLGFALGSISRERVRVARVGRYCREHDQRSSGRVRTEPCIVEQAKVESNRILGSTRGRGGG